jgi:hypothetical protein
MQYSTGSVNSAAPPEGCGVHPPALVDRAVVATAGFVGGHCAPPDFMINIQLLAVLCSLDAWWCYTAARHAVEP